MLKIYIFSLAFITFGCVYFPNAGEVPMMWSPKNVIVTKNVEGCIYLGSVKPTKQIWKPNASGEGVPLEVRRLKAMAKREFQDSNAIGNVIIFGFEKPIGQADVFKCPSEKYQAEREFQLDDKFVLDNIVIENK